MGLEPVQVHVRQLVVLGQRDNRDHRRAILEKVQVVQGRSVVARGLVLLQRRPIALGFDRQQADALDRLGLCVEVGQVDGAKEQVIDVQGLLIFLEHLEFVRARRSAFRHHGFGVGDGHRAGQAHEQVIGVQADGFADVDARPTEVGLVVVGSDGLGGENVEDLL
ncbi:hypothetical protein D3C77_326960 [compost metagenome]